MSEPVDPAETSTAGQSSIGGQSAAWNTGARPRAREQRLNFDFFTGLTFGLLLAALVAQFVLLAAMG